MNNELLNEIQKIIAKPYARRLVPDEDGGYIASIQEFPGCIADGDNPEEALENLNKAAISWLSSALSTGYEVREPVSFIGFSGKVALRIPRGLHKQVAELAELEESSVNQLLVSAISHYVAEKNSYSALTEAFGLEIRKIVADGLISLSQVRPNSLYFSFYTPGVTQKFGELIAEDQTMEKVFNMQPNIPELPLLRAS